MHLRICTPSKIIYIPSYRQHKQNLYEMEWRVVHVCLFFFSLCSVRLVSFVMESLLADLVCGILSDGRVHVFCECILLCVYVFAIMLMTVFSSSFFHSCLVSLLFSYFLFSFFFSFSFDWYAKITLDWLVLMQPI